MLQNDIYERARLARDARFDGVRFFPSAAAAGEAGFRPCLRCRPECAPGTPAWNGTSTTVRRGLRLISNGALDDGNVENLADRLGTQRLHFAKRLIDETTLPMSRVSAAAGYGSIRRFNDAFRNTYGRSPRELRRAGEESELSGRTATLTVRLPYRTPFNWPALLNFFAARATPGVEVVNGDTYYRTIMANDDHGVVEIRPDRRAGYLSLTLHSINTNALFETVQRAREVFDLDAPISEIRTTLGKDRSLKPMLRKNAGVRVPGAWDGFEITIRAILGQQISVKAATTLAGRIAGKYGERLELPGTTIESGLTQLFPTAERLMRARLQNIGLVKSRAETIRRVATAVHHGELKFDLAQDPFEFCDALVAIKGVGDWTAQYVAMRALKNPDAFPGSDLGLIKAIAYPDRVTPKELTTRAEEWRPWRAYAAMLLWSSLPGSGG
jgi:AraC family transcriptional regulator of adaptative response / DNA-3-methyladenine glycosylase II